MIGFVVHLRLREAYLIRGRLRVPFSIRSRAWNDHTVDYFLRIQFSIGTDDD